MRMFEKLIFECRAEWGLIASTKDVLEEASITNVTLRVVRIDVESKGDDDISASISL